MPDEILTGRLRLRPWQPVDLDALHALWTDPGVRRYLWDDIVISRETAAEVLRAGMALCDEHGFGQWAAFLKPESPLIGFCGFRLRDDTPELLYGLASPYWGRGLATEAARGVLHYGFEQCGLTRVVAATDPPNQASVRVLEHLGMRPSRREVQHGVEVLCYEIDRAGFELLAGA